MFKTLEKRIILFSFLILFITILANTGMDVAAYRRDYIQALIFTSQSLGTNLKSSIEKVIALGLDIHDIPGINQKCQEAVDANPPRNDYCIITDIDGTPIFSNDEKYLSFRFDNVIRSLTKKKSEQMASLLKHGDTTYYDLITPLKSADGRLLALIHIGFPETEVANRVASMILRSILLLVLFLVLSFTLVVYFVKKSIIQPISSLLIGVEKISDGELDTTIPELEVFEFNELAKNINLMSVALKNREQEIQNSYQEMEDTHKKLHSSYMKLESLSLELERSEELYKSLLEDASDAIIVVDKDEHIKIVNKMAEDLFGYASQEIVGLPLTKFFLLLNIQNIPRVNKIFKDALSGGHIAEEMQFEKKDGTQVLGRIHASSIRSGGEQLVQAIFRDITKERETVLNLEKSAADLARLNKMKDSFLGLASHELKTPLTVIIGYSELIMTDMAEKIDPTILEMIENISNAASRLDNIIKDMVDVSMIDEKRLQLKVEDVDVNELVNMSVNELRFFFSMRKQGLTLTLDETVPLIKGDRLRLMQLMSNVLGNAIKFTPDGGKIHVTTSAKYLLRSKQTGHNPETEVSIGKEHHLYVEIAISDTGIGIDREDQIRIFDKFYEAGNIQEHSTGKVAFKAKGAGLGLAIAKGIVEMHGGEIWVESPGFNSETYPGSTFHILLPINPVFGDMPIDYMGLLR
jgi:PAS domain S-box-containing protein